jgi:hypothetical protein
MRLCPNYLNPGRFNALCLVGENLLDQIMREIHPVRAIACVQQRPVFQRHDRSGREDDQIAFFPDHLAIDRTDDSFRPLWTKHKNVSLMKRSEKIAAVACVIGRMHTDSSRCAKSK